MNPEHSPAETVHRAAGDPGRHGWAEASPRRIIGSLAVIAVILTGPVVTAFFFWSDQQLDDRHVLVRALPVTLLIAWGL